MSDRILWGRRVYEAHDALNDEPAPYYRGKHRNCTCGAITSFMIGRGFVSPGCPLHGDGSDEERDREPS